METLALLALLLWPGLCPILIAGLIYLVVTR